MIDTFKVFASRDEAEKVRVRDKVAAFAPDLAHVSVTRHSAPGLDLVSLDFESMMTSDAEICPFHKQWYCWYRYPARA